MSGNSPLISNAFQAFAGEAPDHSKAWGEMVRAMAKASDLEPKTRDLCYLAVLAALGLESGIPFHVKSAVSSGASRQEIINAILVGLPAGAPGRRRHSRCGIGG
jgi:alkylhydroperoxidase/carboxymuconolactone decarboxylase family protein YurZ